MFERFRQSNISIFPFSEVYNELSNRIFRANGNISNKFKPNDSRDVQNLYQDKARMDMKDIEFKIFSSTCWNEKHHPRSSHMTKDKRIHRCRLGLNPLVF